MKKISTLVMCLVVFISASAEIKHVKILTVNDMHAAVEKMPKFKAFVDSVRKVDPEVIVLGGGDNRTGNPVNDIYAGEIQPMTQFMNLVGFDASAIGNHEFDSKIQGFRNQINASNFPYLCANVWFPDTMRMHVYPYKQMERNGVKIAILGGIQINSANIPDCMPENVKNVKFVYLDSVVPSYKWLRDQNDVFILLSHNGYENDQQTAKRYPYMDVIVGGHTHTPVGSNVFHNGVLVTQSQNKLKYVTVIDLDVDTDTHKVVKKSSNMVSLPTFSREDAKAKAMLEEFRNSPVLKEKLTDVVSPFNTTEELGNMMMDGLREGLGVDVAVQNGGGVRLSSFPVGPLTVGNLYELDPFANKAVVYEMTGQELEDFIMDCYDTDSKQPVYVSGCSYVMDVKKAENKSDRHPLGIKIKMDKGKFSKTATYKVATNYYVTSISTSKKHDKGIVMKEACSDVIIKWLRQQPTINYTGSSRIKKNIK